MRLANLTCDQVVDLFRRLAEAYLAGRSKDAVEPHNALRRLGFWVYIRPMSDRRTEAFLDWLDASDRCDWKAGRDATRRLRELGISVCSTGKPR